MPSLRIFLTFIILIAGLVFIVGASNKDESRSFIGTSGFSFATFTLIKSTTTLASTLTSTITCTTSGGTLTTCSAGRRRRGLFYDDNEQTRRYRRGLFHDEEQTKDDNIFASSNIQRSNDPVDEILPAKTSADTLIPLELQAGHNLPDGVSANRFLLAFGTSTVTSFIITTSTTSLTARCASITNFPTCKS